MTPVVRVFLLLLAFVALRAAGVFESLIVALLFAAPLAPPLLARDRKALGMACASMAVCLTVGAAGAYSFHAGMAKMLAGEILAREVAWSAWFYGGCFAALYLLDQGLTHALRDVKKKWLATGMRMAVVVLIVPPFALAAIQMVRVKTHYRLTWELAPHQAEVIRTVNTLPGGGGVRLVGHFIDRGSDTTIIVCHGLGAHSSNFAPFLAQVLHDNSYNGLIFDFRGHGASGGHLSTMGPAETTDLLAMIEALREQASTPQEHIVLYGFSMGSAAALYAAPQIPELSAIVIDSGYGRLTDVARDIASDIPALLRPYLYYAGLGAASAISETALWRIRPVQMIDAIEAPILVMHGEADEQIPLKAAQPLLDHPKTIAVRVPGATHVNLEARDSDYFPRVRKFIREAVEE